MRELEASYGRWLLTYRWPVTIATFACAAIITAGSFYLTFDNNLRVFFSKDNPQLQALEAQESIYTKNDNVQFAIAPKNGDVFTRETLSAIEELTDEAWKIPFSSRVDSLTNFQNSTANGDDLLVEDLVRGAMTLSDDDIAKIKNIALSEPLVVNRQVSESGHVAGINVNIVKPEKSVDESSRVAAFTRRISADFKKKHPDIDLYISGSIMIDTAFREAAENDMRTLIPAMFFVLALVVWIVLRSISGLIVTMMVIGLSVSTAMGMAGWMGISLTPPSAIAPTIILTLALADCVHLLVTMFQQMRSGKVKSEAIIESARVNLQPVFITSATTAVGFLTMNFSDVPPFRDLGNIVAIGVVSAFFYSIILLPVLMLALPVRAVAKANVTPLFLDKMADYVINNHRRLFWGMLVFIIALASGLFRIELNDDFVKYFDKRYEFRRDTDFIQDNLTGFDIIEWSLNSGEPGGIYDPGYLRQVDQFGEWFLKQANVVRVISIVYIIKRLNKNMHGDNEAEYKLPENRELAAQYLLLYEMSLPFGLDLNSIINVDKSETRMVATMKNVTSKNLRDTEKRARRWLNQNAPKIKDTEGTGLSIMFAYISKRNIESMLAASFLALALISAILILAFRDFKMGVISLMPNLSPALMAFGVWGYTAGTVGLAISVIVAMTIGIVVDDTVHFISKYLRARREKGMTAKDAVRFSFNSVGAALFATTAALVCGFLVLTLSGFKLNSDMGLLSAIAIFIALILDFFFLPPLLTKADN